MATVSCNKILPEGSFAGWQRWSPGVLPGSTPPTATRRDNASDESLKQRAYAAGFEAGQRAGFEAGHAEGRARADAQAAQIARVALSAAAALHALGDTLSRKTVTLALGIAQKILLHEIDTRPETIVDIVREALTLLPEGTPRVRILVNTADADVLRAQLAHGAGEPDHFIVGSDEVQRGGCHITSPSGDIDASLDTRINRVLETLGMRGGDTQDVTA